MADDYMGMIRDLLDDDLARIYDPGNWFQLPRSFLAIMSEGEAVLLAYLLNQSYLRKAHKREGKFKGWFTCRKTKVHMDLFMSHKKQQRNMTSLVTRGFLATKWRGLPAKRYIKVMIRNIYDRVIEFEARADKCGVDEKTLEKFMIKEACKTRQKPAS